VLEPRGTVTIKGKGEVEAWYLIGRRAAAPLDDTERVATSLPTTVGLVDVG
jgi:hypothetical protein